VAFAGPLGIAAPVPVGTMVMVPLIMCGGTMPDGMCSIVPDGIATMELGGMGGTAPDGVGAIEPEGIGAIELGCIVLAAGIGFIEVEGLTGNSLEGLNPLQRPPLQMLYAHCASLWHSALKFPH
jgi:hypothetical protein